MSRELSQDLYCKQCAAHWLEQLSCHSQSQRPTRGPPLPPRTSPQPLSARGSATTAGVTPPAPLDMVLHPDITFFSGTSAGENSTTSTDRGRMAELPFTSLPPTGAIRRAGQLIPAGRIPRRGALTLPYGPHPASNARSNPTSNSAPPQLSHYLESHEHVVLFSAGVRLPNAGKPWAFGVHRGL